MYLHQRIEEYEKIHFLYYDIKTKLAEAHERIMDQQNTIFQLQRINTELARENLDLVRTSREPYRILRDKLEPRLIDELGKT
jgi:hypothetical protein